MYTFSKVLFFEKLFKYKSYLSYESSMAEGQVSMIQEYICSLVCVVQVLGGRLGLLVVDSVASFNQYLPMVLTMYQYPR